MVDMKCENCGFENNDKAKFCTKCGTSLSQKSVPSGTQGTDNSKYVIIALVIVVILLAAAIGYFALGMNSNGNDSSQNVSSQNLSASESASDDAKTQQVSSSQDASSTKVAESKSWQSIGSYSGSGSGSQTIKVPSGKIMVKLSAYPIKNYATNHLYVSGSNGASGGVDWDSHSDVETRSDSFEYTSSSEETFTIDYYETVSWEVEFFRYQ